MIRSFLLGSALLLAMPIHAARAQELPAQPITGTTLDVVAVGEVKKVPDVVQINAGVTTQAPTAGAAIEQNARRMTAVRAALRGAGIPDRDIQTSALSLNPDYRQGQNSAPVLAGYQASNQLLIRFRDIASTGKILDALVAQGINQFNGPMLTIDKPEAALDEARVLAIRSAQARAELYASTLGKRVKRILSVSEAGQPYGPYGKAAGFGQLRTMDSASTAIDPGEQTVSVSLTVSFELQ